jgi:polyhydroxyalkanoate synthesis repressor PhaR
VERIIKRYRNRKMYDTVRKEYVNFSDIEKMIRDNESVRIIDNVSGDDITRQTLIQLIMRTDPVGSDSGIPLENLRNMLQNKDNLIFQAVSNVLNFGKDMVAQFTSRVAPADSPTTDSGRQGLKSIDQLKSFFEKLSDSMSRLIDGTLAREMLKVPKRDDMNRIARKMKLLEKKINQLKETQKGG